MFFTFAILNWVTGVLVVILSALIAYLFNQLTYFKRHNIVFEQPYSLRGNVTTSYGKDLSRLYKKFKNEATPLFGMYLSYMPTIYVTNLDLIKNILIKDFHTFPERGLYHNKKVDPLSAHLFNMDKEGWKEQRSKLSPTFTSGKMKYMFSTVCDITERLGDVLEDQIGKQDCTEIELKEYLARFGTDVIGNVAFGTECNSLRNPDAEFREFGRKSIANIASNFLLMQMKRNSPQLARMLGLRNTTVEVEKFCFQIVRQTMDYRSKNNVRRNDFMDLLLEMKKTEQNPNGLEIGEIAAHTFVFFLAGFETTSTTMGFTLYELSLHQDVQQQVRNEVNEILEKHDGQLTYACLEEMTYLDQVINETLRMYPPVIELHRRCVRDYKVLNSDLTIPSGARVTIPISDIHRDSAYYVSPNEFRPERFAAEEMKSRHPMSFIPFGDGPRNCIGLRFGRMQAKLGLATLIKRFNFTPGEKLTIPVQMNESALLRQSKDGLWFKISKV